MSTSGLKIFGNKLKMSNNSIINWNVLSNDGTNLVAKNKITNETFSGTTEDFNLLVKNASTLINNNVSIIDPSGNPLNNFIPFNLPLYDDVRMEYTADVVSEVTYFLNDVLVATLTLTYVDGILTRVKKT